MRWIVIAITVKKKTILFPCGGLRGARLMIEILTLVNPDLPDRWHYSIICLGIPQRLYRLNPRHPDHLDPDVLSDPDLLINTVPDLCSIALLPSSCCNLLSTSLLSI